MIDAYEIGIRLLLQDEVSAGLAVINQALVEVDRGIAATSAHLAALVHQSETAAKAVAAVAGKTITPLAPQQAIDPSRLEAPKAAPEQRADTVSPGMKPEVAVIRETLVEPEAKRGGDREPRDPSNAPTPATGAVSVAREPPQRIEEGPRGTVVPTLVVTAPDSLPAAVKPTRGDSADLENGVQRTIAPPVSDAPVSPVKPVEPALPVGGSVAPREPSRVDVGDTVTASVASSRADLPQSTPRLNAARHDAQFRPERARPAAPRSDPGDTAKPKELNRSSEPSSAPTSQVRERNDSVGGAVMLDGRLVGQWLSDHMAQEASRPPGGTSFFDPRQTPAWTISGAI